MSTPLVRFHQVSKKYFMKQALKDVSLELQSGEIFGYIGPNGAGKTTTMKILVGLIQDFEGELTVAGLRLPEKRSEVHKFIGYLPQGVSFQRWRTVKHGLMTFGRLSGVDDATLEKDIPYWLDRFELGDVPNKKVRLLSGGMMQKVGFIQALLHRPRLLVLDEPLSGLDPQSRLLVKEIIRELRDNGTTIIFSSHILSDVQDVADRMGLINHGQVAMVGTLDQLKREIGLEEDLMIEFAELPTDTGFLAELAGQRPLEKVRENHFRFSLAPEDNRDALTDALIRETFARNGKIRQIGNVATSLDILYTRYLAKR